VTALVTARAEIALGRDRTACISRGLMKEVLGILAERDRKLERAR
jgi:hypothetical protein